MTETHEYNHTVTDPDGGIISCTLFWREPYAILVLCETGWVIKMFCASKSEAEKWNQHVAEVTGFPTRIAKTRIAKTRQ